MTNLIDITDLTDTELDALLDGAVDARNPFGSDDVWEIVARMENGERVSSDEIKALTPGDRIILNEESLRMAEEFTKKADARLAKKAAAPRHRLGISCPVGFCYEGATLRRDERDESRWT